MFLTSLFMGLIQLIIVTPTCFALFVFCCCFSENVNMICIVYGEQRQRKMKYIFLLSFLIMSVFILHTRVTNASTISSADFPSSLSPLTAKFLIDQQHQTAALLLPVPAASRTVRDAHRAPRARAVRHRRRGPFKFQLSETLVCHMDVI